MSYLVHDLVNDQNETFRTIEEARQYINEMLLFGDEGYSLDEGEIAEIRIYKAVERVELDTSSEETEGFWSHTFKPIEP